MYNDIKSYARIVHEMRKCQKMAQNNEKLFSETGDSEQQVRAMKFHQVSAQLAQKVDDMTDRILTLL